MCWAISQFSYIGCTFNKALLLGFFGCKFWIYSTVFTPHIYFIILTSMIAGNIVEIRLPQIQNRKCLRKSNIWRYRAENVLGNFISMILDRRVISISLVSTQAIFSFHDVWNVLFRLSLYSIFDLLLVVVFFHYVIYCCQYHEPPH